MPGNSSHVLIKEPTMASKVKGPGKKEHATAGTAASVSDSIGRYIALLGSDDPVTVARASTTLCLTGKAAVGPLASSLTESPSAWQRAAILNCLAVLSGVDEPAVLFAITGASRSDPDSRLRDYAAVILKVLM
jgi:hypothetical protein